MKFSRRSPAVIAAGLATVVGLGVLAAAQGGVYRSLPGPGALDNRSDINASFYR